MAIFFIINGVLFLFILLVAGYIEFEKRKMKKELLLSKQENKSTMEDPTKEN